MNKKELALYGIILAVIQALISTGFFVTYQQMIAYAAPKSDIIKLEQHLLRIEEKIDNYLSGGY